MSYIYNLGLAATVLAACVANAQVKVSEVKVKTDPADGVVRPFETVVVQAMMHGTAPNLQGQPERVRLQNRVEFQLLDPGGGWVSKPFRYQGSDTEAFYRAEERGLQGLLSRAQGSFVLQDAALYTAPEKPGSYRVEVKVEGQTAVATIKVDAGAPSYRKPEKISFPAEAASRDRYRKLAEHYSPLVAQETWFQPKSDFLARFDYDGDWRGDNNWDSLDDGASQAYVYYTTMETQTHWFVIYNLFHPRDYSDKCVAGTCHEDDNEGLILTVAKDGGEFGRLQVMETLAHNNIYSYRADPRVDDGVHRFDGNVEFHEQSHPVIFVESGGHGIYGSRDDHSRYSLERDEFAGSTGVTYVYRGVAERPRHPNDRRVGYDLLPIYEHWWLRAHEGTARSDHTFDEYYTYQPLGGRPGARYEKIAGSFFGRKESSNKAKPFWGWHDERTRKQKILATGQWGLDPAYAVSRNLRFPREASFSLEYVFNPYLAVGESPAAPLATNPAPATATTLVAAPATAAATTLAASAPAAAPATTTAPAATTTTAAPAAEVTPAAAPAPAGDALSSSDNDPSKYDTDREGRFEFRGTIDGEVIFRIRGDRVWAEVLGGRPVQVERFSFSQPLPAAALDQVELERKDGRGDVALVERPTNENDNTAAIQVNDRRGGADRYHFRLTWRRLD